jgi:hypothetical protein
MLIKEALVPAGLIYCYYCRTIHHPSKTGYEYDEHTDSDRERACSKVERFKTGMDVHDRFTYSRIQALMHQYRNGFDYTALMEILTQTSTPFTLVGDHVHKTATSDSIRELYRIYEAVDNPKQESLR